MKFIVYSNWKMHLTQREVAAFVRTLRAEEARFSEHIEFVLCASYTLIPRLSEEARDAHFISPGAQNVHAEEWGAFTGEVSAAQLADAGACYCVVGHSERRRDFGETDELVNRKARAALKVGISPLICIGEDFETRRAGKTEQAIAAQMERCLRGVSESDIGRVVILYEPVWCVGSGQNATAGQAGDAHRLIRSLLRARYPRESADAARIIYGGSVTPENAQDLLATPDIDGLGMGKASLDVDRFMKVAELSARRLAARPLRPLTE
jgi:triosephosphate isomerase (TIM)